jgi:plastocyanin
VVCGLAIAWFPVSAAAGSVAGEISVGSGKVKDAEVAVWLESSKTGPAPSTKPVITQRDMEFSPQLLLITVGQTVVMPNDDDVAHNVYSKSPARTFNLGIYPKGLSKEVTFSEPGIIDVECSMHRRMKATIIVSSTPYHTMGHAGSHYEILGVPAGAYVLHAWSAQLGDFHGQVTVSALGAAELRVTLKPSGVQ